MTTAVKSGSSAAMIAAFDKEFGGNADNATPTEFIDTGFGPLNFIMSGRYDGGLPFGRMIEVFGESSTGKTALATDWMARAQQMGGAAGFIDWERSFNQDVAEHGYGLSVEKPLWFYKKPDTWEQGNTLAAKYAKWVRENKIIPESAPILIVLDSIAAAVPKSMQEKDFDEYSMNDTTALARVTSTTLKSMAQYAERFNATFVYLNQMRLKPGVVYGDPRTTPGGKAMEFYATARLALGREKIMQTVAGGKEFVGQKINIQCVKSKMTKPFKETAMRLTFDESGVAYFDKEFSLVEEMIEKKKIATPRNGYVEYEGTQYSKKQMAEKIRTEGLGPKMIALMMS